MTSINEEEPEIVKGQIRVGISSCLLGKKVRYNGGHKENDYITNVLDDFFTWVSVCPEVEIGMGTPREAVRLVGSPDQPRMVGTNTGTEWTDKINTYSIAKTEKLKTLNLHGYILKNRSPSCGLFRVKVYTETGMPLNNGAGLFARALSEGMPYLPIEEEGRLNDARLRENFIIRVFCYYRWQELISSGFTIRKLVEFHSRHKFLIMSHNETAMRELGKLVAQGKSYPEFELIQNYRDRFFNAIKRPSTRNRHVNVLQHIMGFFKSKLSPQDKIELLTAIGDYQNELVPLIVPITLFRHYLRLIKHDYIGNQYYLNPHPKELMLLNHV